MATPIENWARNLTYQAKNLVVPACLEELQEIVDRSEKVKALGTKHSFSSIADTTGTLVSLQNFTAIKEIDVFGKRAVVEPGITYGKFSQELHRYGLALHNLASLPHISVGGAVATATHGSGDANGNLATTVSELKIVLANGEVMSLARNDEYFNAAVVGLGALGIVVEMTLDLLPAFEMSQVVYENLPFQQLEQNFDAITSSAYSVSLFTDWKGPEINQVWLKGRVDSSAFPQSLFGTNAAKRQVHPVPGMPAEFCTGQLGVQCPSHEILPHFKMAFTPSSGEELQTEYLVSRKDAVSCLQVLAPFAKEIADLLQICEIRTMAADNLWLSPSYHRDSVGIHFTWKKHPEAVRYLLPKIEKALAPFQPRPHWAKLFRISGIELEQRYEKMDSFRHLATSLDPNFKFRNAFLEHAIFA
ncbi:MAG TPA: FAD-binding protein [Fimbriimonadaceae bacterium]|jgi:xylitol oxidase